MTPNKSRTAQPLFRTEVLEAQGTKLLGQVLLTPKASTLWLCIVCALVGAAIVAFLALGSYTRRATVTGQLIPSTGVMRIHTPQAGVVLEKKVEEGQLVKKGDVLYVLTSDRVGADTREIQADISSQVNARKQSLETELVRNRTVLGTEISHLERRANTLRGESQAIAKQIEQQRIRLKLAEDARSRYQSLADKDFVAREQLFQKEAELTEQQLRLQSLERDALVAQRELASTMQEMENTRVRYANQNALLQRSVSSAQQELTEVEARRRVVIVAPEAGRATLVTTEIGQVVDTNRPLMNLVPENAQLEARLYAPSSTVGFVRQGAQVQLRYQSFPYQKFGQYEGVVTSVSSTSVPSTELASFALPNVGPGEPIYAITVELKRQTVTAYGEPRPLAAGMRLEADILQETRKLYEWMLEPLFSITGKM